MKKLEKFFDGLQGFLDYVENNKKERERIRKKHKDELAREQLIMKIVKRRWLGFMLLVIFIGLIVPYGAQFWPLPCNIHAEMWNSYTSIVLGIVATICSLLSIYMTFYSLNLTFNSNNNTIDDMNAIRQEIQVLAIQIAKTKQSIDDLAGQSNNGFVSVPVVKQEPFQPEDNIIPNPTAKDTPCEGGCDEVKSKMKELK